MGKTAIQAWADVMASIRAVAKGGINRDQGFTFRGIEQVMNAVGPALREHGVAVIPTVDSIDVERYATARGTGMMGVIVTMTFTVIGPDGDSFTGSAYGQAADSGDKAVTKAQSVALRTFLTQSLMIPTNDPDPDEDTHERRQMTPEEEAEAAVWAATARFVQPGTDPDSAESVAHRRKVLEWAFKETGVKPRPVDPDNYRRVYGALNQAQVPPPASEGATPAGQPDPAVQAARDELWRATEGHGADNKARIQVMDDALAAHGTNHTDATAERLRAAITGLDKTATDNR